MGIDSVTGKSDSQLLDGIKNQKRRLNATLKNFKISAKKLFCLLKACGKRLSSELLIKRIEKPCFPLDLLLETFDESDVHGPFCHTIYDPRFGCIEVTYLEEVFFGKDNATTIIEPRRIMEPISLSNIFHGYCYRRGKLPDDERFCPNCYIEACDYQAQFVEPPPARVNDQEDCDYYRGACSYNHTLLRPATIMFFNYHDAQHYLMAFQVSLKVSPIVLVSEAAFAFSSFESSFRSLSSFECIFPSWDLPAEMGDFVDFWDQPDFDFLPEDEYLPKGLVDDMDLVDPFFDVYDYCDSVDLEPIDHILPYFKA